MTWTSRELEVMVDKAKRVVARELNISYSDLKCPVYLASREELDNAIIDELRQLHYLENDIQRIIRYYLPFVIGKYFQLSKQIWVLYGKGDNMDTIIHELLHSIQSCEPNREGIVNYLTYKISGNLEFINEYVLEDWQEIERISSYLAIKNRLITEGDCEDF